MRLFLLTGYVLLLIASGRPVSASDELQFIIDSQKPPSNVFLMLQDNTVQPCNPGQINGSRTSGFLCSIPDFDTMALVDTYNLVIQGSDLDLHPIKIRVYPTMKVPTVISIDLTDGVFLKAFVPTHDYYVTWLAYDRSRPMGDFEAYLVVRNLYSKLEPGVNSTTAYVLRRWLERARYTAENIPFEGVDSDVLDSVRDIRGAALSNPQKEVLATVGPPPPKAGVLSDQDRLIYADWYIFAISRKAYDVEIKRRQSDFCRLYEAFEQSWSDANDQAKNAISQIWAINDSIVTDPGKSRPFAACTKGPPPLGSAQDRRSGPG